MITTASGILGWLSSVAPSISGVYFKTRQYRCLRHGWIFSPHGEGIILSTD
jgi:hypothetical protein